MANKTRNEHGGVTLEMTLLFPVLLFLCMLIVQMGLYWHAKTVAEAAAQDGAAAARQFDGTEDGAVAKASRSLSALGPRMLTDRLVTVDRGPEQVEVRVQGVVISLIPGFTLRVEESAGGPVERYVPQN